MYEKELRAAIDAALTASKAILEIYATDFQVEIKDDDSPVTAADKASDQIIRDILQKAFPRAGFLTEEGKDDKKRLKKDYVWIVDPLDGTSDFVDRSGQFSINIALSYRGDLVLGVIYLPTVDLLYYAVKGEGAYRKDKTGKISLLRVNDKKDKLTVLVSRSHFNAQEKAMIKKHSDRIAYEAAMGASAKFCAIAEGQAELSYRLSAGTKEWDVAPGDLIVREAGGVVLQTDMTPFTYNREDVYNRKGYVIANCLENVIL